MPLPQKKLIPGLLLALVVAAIAAPPIWWSEGNPPVINANPANNKGPANIGQAKHMAKSALDALEAVLPAVADEIETDLVGPGKPIPSWNAPANQDERDKNHAPLLIGQLKAIAHPFYHHLNVAADSWLLQQIQLNHTPPGANISNAAEGTHYWHVTSNLNFQDGYYPWNPATPAEQNKTIANIGQLKAVFSLRFEALATFDSDGDGMPDLWEIENGFDANDPADAYSDPDGDGITNQQELALGTDPNSPDPIGPRNLDFGDAVQGAHVVSFRPANPSELYLQESIPHWQAAMGTETKYIEIWNEGNGNPYVELQSDRRSHGVKQTFRMLPGTTVSFLLAYKGRYHLGQPADNAFDVKVEGAASVKVNGFTISFADNIFTRSFMETDSGNEWADWSYATVAIFAPTGANTLHPITLSLVPQVVSTDKRVTRGGFVDMATVDVQDNEIATGVDRISRTVSSNDRGFQEDFWIMAPLQGPESFTHPNLTKFRIGLGGNDVGILSCENATPDTDTGTGTSNQMTLNGQPHDVIWQGTGIGVDSEKVVKMKINGNQTDTALPVKVKAMKYREVKVAVHEIVSVVPGKADNPPDHMPSEAQVEEKLNRVFGQQINAWFDVTVLPSEPVKFDVADANAYSPRSFVPGAQPVPGDGRLSFFLWGLPEVSIPTANRPAGYDIHVYVLGGASPIMTYETTAEDPSKLKPSEIQIGRANTAAGENYCIIDGDRTSDVIPAHQRTPEDVLHTIAHEIGHILVGGGHPDEGGGNSPLVGTDSTQRLMCSGFNWNLESILLVKQEWDDAEVWLKANIDQP